MSEKCEFWGVGDEVKKENFGSEGCMWFEKNKFWWFWGKIPKFVEFWGCEKRRWLAGFLVKNLKKMKILPQNKKFWGWCRSCSGPKTEGSDLPKSWRFLPKFGFFLLFWRGGNVEKMRWGGGGMRGKKRGEMWKK